MIPFVYSRRVAWIVVVTVALIIAVLSLIPDPEDVLPVTLWDKLEHFLAYGVLAFALSNGLARSGWSLLPRILLGIALATGYGALMEGLQFFVPPREMDITDALANFLGSCMGMAADVFVDLGCALRDRQRESRRLALEAKSS